MKTFKYVLSSFLGLLLSLSLSAEIPKKIIVSGKILEATSSIPIEYATVTLLSLSDSLLTGTITREDGTFEIESPLSDFYIQVNYMGYRKLTIKDFQVRSNRVHIGDRFLELDRQNLGEVVARAEKSQVEFKIDKRVFNVGQDLTSAGGSVLDVLNNVPSVDVNLEGEVSLRGNSSVQMLINGKPSVLTNKNSLGTITAEMIDKIEVVTNPSAKYDAEGTTGIINIIIKKEDKKGLNGAISLNTGYPNNHSVGISMNRRTEKFNLFSQFGIGKNTFLPSFNGQTIDRTDDYPSSFFNKGDGHKHEQFYNIILGTDYHINKWNMLTLSGHYGYEIEDQDSKTNYWTEEYDGSISSKSMREEITEATNPAYEFDLSYKKSFESNEERSLKASAMGSFFSKDSESLYLNTAPFSETVHPSQREVNDYGNAEYSLIADYLHPFSEKTILETGIKYTLQQLYNDYHLDNKADDDWVTDPNYANVFNYDQHLAAAFLTWAWEPGKFGIKLGSRLEHTRQNTELKNTGEENEHKYTNLFPSAHLSYKLGRQFSIQTGYSRRISRPHWRDLNPFTSFRDSYNLSMGNPALKPEYTDAFELSAIQIMEYVSLNGSLFYRHTTDVITEVIEVQDSLTITYPDNIGNSNNAGLELNGKFELAKWLTFLMDSHFTAYNRKGQFEAQSFDFNATFWTGKLTTKVKLPKDIDAEFLIRHHSKYRDFQSTSEAQTYADFGIKKKFLNGKAVINLSVRDIFGSRKWVSIADTSTFYRYSEGMRDGRRFIIGFSYGFGKGEAMEYHGQD